MSSAIKVALIDDSAIVRKHLAELLTQAGMQVTITASDPLFAWPKLQADWPDVIVLDVEMPRMDGISFLKQLMSEHPLPVVMCSTLTEAGCETTLQALAAGAVNFVTKPKLGLRNFLEDGSNGLVAAVRAAAKANVRAIRRSQAIPVDAGPNISAPSQAMAVTTERIIALGSSTGGVQAMEAVLPRLPRTMPGVLLVQHMPAQFTGAFASRLNGLCQMEVLEAKDGDRVIAGRVLIAPGGKHMQLRRSGAQYVVEVRDGPLVNHHKPSVDVLFKSVAQQAGRNAYGAIFTGMGDDGARGMLEMHRAGAFTIAQDEASCIVHGMPRMAVQQGGVDIELPLERIAAALVDLAQNGRKPQAVESGL